MDYSDSPYGIPIPEEVRALYTAELQEAWRIVDDWWTETFEGELVSRSLMPEYVRDAYDLIRMTPIPGFEEDGPTGAESCYMVNLDSFLID